MPAITIAQISKAYRSRRTTSVQAVSDLDLTVTEGEVIGFLGPNGAGKTTTIKMLCGLILPDAGSIHIQGINVQRRRRQAMPYIGAVLEGTRNVYWRLSPWQNMAYAARLKGMRTGSTREWGEILLRDLDLWDRRHDPIRMFSRGMQQKTAIACALIHNPPIILLDEPTLGLDVQSAVTVKQWIQTLSTRYGKTLVLTTHQLALAEELCQRVVIINGGTKVADQTVQELRALYRRELLQVTVAAEVPALQELVTRQWPQATLQAHAETTVISIPADAQVRLAEVARIMEQWPFEILSIQQAVPSLEDIFIHITDTANNHA